MGETAVHASLVHSLVSVLHWLFQGQHCAIYENLNFYQTPNTREYPLAPDIAVIKGVDYIEDIRSWRVGKTGPASHVLFEIASEETWKKDLYEKPLRYARMGVQEYFAYDPHPDPVYRGIAGRRLLGWRLVHGVLQEMTSDSNGRLWSAQLDSFLLPDGTLLRLTDRQGYLRLTEAEAQARRAEAEAQRAEAEARRANIEAQARRAETRRANIEAQRALAEARRANAESEARKAEARRAEAEARRAETLAEKLRSLGIDPDSL